MRTLLVWSATGALLAAVSSLEAQSLEARVAAVRDGAVTFHFTPRPGVCGDGEHFVRTGRHQYHGSWNNGSRYEPCIPGPVQVRLSLEGGDVHRVQSWVGPVRSRGETRDLGAVPATEAARYLMTIASRSVARASDKAVMPAVLADSAVVWPELLAIAKDRETRSRNTRREALLWLSRFASGAVLGRPNDPFVEDESEKSESDELKTQAVFVLSQLRNNEGVPELLQVARSNSSPRVRSQAMFWLGQSEDPRALALFESLLRR